MSQQSDYRSTMETAQETFEFPMNQAVEYQRTLAQLVLNSLEMGDWMQSRGIELTKRTFDNYLRMLETTGQQMSQASMSGVRAAGQAGQSMAGPQRDQSTGGQFRQRGTGTAQQSHQQGQQPPLQYQQQAASPEQYYPQQQATGQAPPQQHAPQPRQGVQQPFQQPVASPPQQEQGIEWQQEGTPQGQPPMQNEGAQPEPQQEQPQEPQ